MVAEQQRRQQQLQLMAQQQRRQQQLLAAAQLSAVGGFGGLGMTAIAPSHPLYILIPWQLSMLSHVYRVFVT